VKRCWNQDPHLRPEMSEVLETLRGSDPSTDKPSPSRLATPLNLPPSSEDWEPSSGIETPLSRSGSAQTSDSSQAAIHNPVQSESNSHYSEDQGREPSRPTVQNQSRRGTDQSELYTPLPVDPVQVDSNQRPDWTGKPHINLLDSAGPVLTLSVPNQTGDSHSSTSTHFAGSHSTNNLRNLNQSQHNLRDLGTTGGKTSPEDLPTNPHSGSPPSQPEPTERAGIPSRQVSKPNHMHKDGKGEQGTREKSERPPVTPSTPKKQGIWSRIMRKLCCISDEHTSA